jgi:hypothetical protein
MGGEGNVAVDRIVAQALGVQIAHGKIIVAADSAVQQVRLAYRMVSLCKLPGRYPTA